MMNVLNHSYWQVCAVFEIPSQWLYYVCNLILGMKVHSSTLYHCYSTFSAICLVLAHLLHLFSHWRVYAQNVQKLLATLFYLSVTVLCHSTTNAISCAIAPWWSPFHTYSHRNEWWFWHKAPLVSYLFTHNVLVYQLQQQNNILLRGSKHWTHGSEWLWITTENYDLPQTFLSCCFNL